MPKYVNPKMLLDEYDRAPAEGEIMINKRIAFKIEIHKVDIERQYATYSIFDFANCPDGELTGANGKYFKHLFQAYSFED